MAHQVHQDALPEWATLRVFDEEHENAGEPDMNGEAFVIVVDAGAMYEAIQAEYREFYQDGHGELTGPEWVECLKELKAKTPTAYWLEVFYQTGKLDLQAAARTFALNIHMKGADKSLWGQKGKAPGRGIHMAAGGASGGREARVHAKRLRGFIIT